MSRISSVLRPLTVALFVTLVACSGDSDPMTPPTTPPPDTTTPPPTRVVKDNPAFQADIYEVFTRRGCTAAGCHGAAQQAGLSLSSATAAFNNLVGVTATSEPIVRVIPNDADGSYLVIKLEGRQTVGEQMPQGGPALDTIDLNNIKNWINNGAPNN